MVIDQIFYFIIVIGVLVTVHEFGHFIAARLCGMRTDVFSIGFGTRLLGFNKRSGFSFLETPPNKITIPIEPDLYAPSQSELFQPSVQERIERACRDHAASAGMEVIEYSCERSAESADAASVNISYAQSKRAPALHADADQLRAALGAVLREERVAAKTAEPVFSFEGAGMCDYRLALLPLGGYVKISGMVDESMDTGFLNRAPQPWEFRAHPAWQRSIVISAGVAMNVVLAVVLFFAYHYNTGEETLRTRTVGYIVPNSIAAQTGFQSGDEITAIGGTAVSNWSALYPKLLDAAEHNDVRVDVRRSGTPIAITFPASAAAINNDSVMQKVGLYPENTLPVVVDLNEGSPAAKGGLLANDAIINADSVKVYSDVQLIGIIHAHAGKALNLDVQRADGMHHLTVTPSDSGRIGIAIANLCLGPKDTTYSFSHSLTAGVTDVEINFKKLGGLLVNLLTGRASLKDNLGGPIAIAKMAGRTAERGIGYLFLLMASLSVSLAGLNILPVPALDGGHLLFIIIESIMHREVPNKVKVVVQQVGFALLLLLMFFVVFNDLRR